MNRSVRHALALGSLALVACSVDTQDPHVGSTDEAIVRATADGGKDQVVLLYMQVLSGTQIKSRTCSGTYYAPRVVLTAAHCMAGVFQNQVFAYYGNDFATDFSKLTQLGALLSAPPPGPGTVWAQADSFQTHPDWDPSLVHPDMAVVFLDRELPFEPLPLARFRIGNDFVGQDGTLVGWGASQSLTADLSQTVGGRIQRTGKAKILGSPTAADFHPEDPNPGMLVPSIRRDTLKTDGRAPNSNTCAGDSGSPLLVKSCGRQFVAGVSSWTGQFCEDYSLFARIDSALPFLDMSAERGGDAPLDPHLNCVAQNKDGSLSAYFGYDNQNGVSLDIPFGRKNVLDIDVSGRRPTHFLPGNHDFVFGVEFDKKQNFKYSIKSDDDRSAVHVDKHSPMCGADVANQVNCGGFCRAGFAAGCTDALPSDMQCISDCLSQFDAFPECSDQINALNKCNADTPPGGDHWTCNGDDFMPSSNDCNDETNAFLNCLFGG